MTKPLLAVDIDEVLSDTATDFVRFSNERWGTHLTPEDYDEHWAQMWQIDVEETKRRGKIYHESGMIGQLGTVVHAKEALAKLKEKFDIVLVTSRPLAIEQETRAWLEANYQDIAKDIYFAGIYDGSYKLEAFLHTKANVFSTLMPDYVIDDQPKHCKAAEDLGIKSILFGNYRWNRDEQNSSHITRCSNWHEVLDYFENV